MSEPLRCCGGQVSPQVKPLLDSLRTLHQTCATAPQLQAPNKKREMDDNSKKMGQLFWKLNAGYVHVLRTVELKCYAKSCSGTDLYQYG